jgi:hypothetical protein
MIVTDEALAASPTSLPSARIVSSDLSTDALQRLGIHTPETLDDLCAKEAKKQFVVEGLVSAGSVGIVVGIRELERAPSSTNSPCVSRLEFPGSG